MIVKEIIGLGVAFIVLAGIAYAIANGDATVKIIGASGDAFTNAVKAATPPART